MNAFLAFLKKEWMEQVRSGRLTILLLLFILLGIMNPAFAKLTPWLMETMADSLASTGLTVSSVTIDASDSWTQFFKNIPISLLVFVLLFGGIMTGEYQKGTLIPVLTRGLSRAQVIGAKTALMMLLWTICYWLCFGITYGYNAFFWDNSIMSHLMFAALCYWLFGLFILAVLMLFSAPASGSSTVLVGTGGVYLLSYVAGMFPAVKEYVPTYLTDTASLFAGVTKPEDYYCAIGIALLLVAGSMVGSILLFNRKKI